jgi:YfiH family protein
MTGGEFLWTDDELPLLVDRRAASDLGVKFAFTKRPGGVSAAPFDSLNLSPFVGDDPASVTENQGRVAAALGVPGLKLVKQVHRADVLDASLEELDERAPCILGEGDAIVAGRSETSALMVMSADCVPILLAGPERIAAVHAGWRGLVAGVIERAVESVGEVGAAWVGPSIKGCCYEVGSEVTGAFERAGLPVMASDRVDPADAAASILRRAGIRDVTVSPDCTSCDRSFFSHRRDGPCGRQAAVIAWA